MAKTKISCERFELIRNRGVGVIRLPAPKIRVHGTFRWLRDPTENTTTEELSSATWYTDGSLVCGQWKALRSTGFGVVVVAADGKLLGYGYGTPPSRIAIAAAAELWAIDFVLAMCPSPPRMKTDCMSILTAARGGSLNATSAARPLARLWRSIEDTLDGDSSQLLGEGVLSWIPAHLSIRAVGERKLPDGSRLTMIDWRANRLVDILAKRGANEHCATSTAQKMLKSMTSLTRHLAAQLGRVATRQHHRRNI